MAKYISLKLEPPTGTAFDYLINVEEVSACFPTGSNLFVNLQNEVPFPLDSGSGATNKSVARYVRGLFLEAKQRPGNHYIVAAEDGPISFTSFS